MRRGTVIAVLVSACGRLDFGITTPEVAVDAPADGCVRSPFGSPRALSELDSPETDFGGQISPDGLTYYFDSYRGSSDDLYVAHRASRAASFDAPQRIDELDTGNRESDPTITGDGLELVYTSDTSGQPCFYDSRRATVTGTWQPSILFHDLCNVGGAFLTIDGLTLVYNTLVDGVGEGTLMTSHRASRDDGFAAGSPIDELSSGATKGYPALSSDELTIYYESTGDGSHLQIWQAVRGAKDEAFGVPALVPGADDNDTSNLGDVSITEDGLELYFASDRNGQMNNDLYVSTRACP